MAGSPVEQARALRRSIAASLIAVKGHLDSPYPDDDRWTPWTRFVERELPHLDELVRLVENEHQRAERVREERDALANQLHAANRVTAALDDTDPFDAIRQAVYMGDRGQECVCSERGGKCYMHAQQERAEAAMDVLRSERDAWVASHIEKDKELWMDADEIGKLERSIQYERDRAEAAEARAEAAEQALRDAGVVIERMANGASRRECSPELDRVIAALAAASADKPEEAAR